MTYAQATAIDVAGPVSLTYSMASGTLFPVATNVVTVTAFNAALNFVTMTFTVVVF